jgi:hypothetical protein
VEAVRQRLGDSGWATPSVRLLRSRHVVELPRLVSSEEIVAATATVVGEMAVLATPRGDRPGSLDCRPRVYLYDGDQTWRAIPLTATAM